MKIFAFLHKKMGTFLQNLQRMSTLEVYFARNVEKPRVGKCIQSNWKIESYETALK